MIPDCFLDWIGLQGCGTTTPPSGVYLNDLAGIDLKKVDNLANEEQQNYVGLWADVQKRALRKFQKDIRNTFLEKYKLKGVAQTINFGKKIDTSETTAAATQYRGTKIELNNALDDVVYSVLQAINVQAIRVYVPSGTPTFNIKVFDLDTEQELFTQEVTGVTGWNDIQINEHFMARRIFVCYDSTLIDSVSLDLSDFNLDNCDKCKSRMRGGYSTIASPYEVTENIYETYGLSVISSIECVWDKLACNNKDSFTQAFLYLCAIEFVIEWKNSERVNRYTMIDGNKADWLLGYYSTLYRGGVFEEIEYDSELMTAINQFNIDQADCCVECSGEITFQDALI